MTQSTRPTEVDIQHSPNGRMTDNDHAIIDDLVATIGNLDLSTTHHSALRRAYEIPTAISFVIANLGLLLKLFGVTDYFKTRMQERAKLDAKRSARKRLQSRLSDSPMVEKLSDLRNKDIVLSISVHTSEEFEDEKSANHLGGLMIKGYTVKEISNEVEGYIYHIPALLNLINSKFASANTIGGIYTELLPTGDLEVKWMMRGSGEIETHVLHRDRNS